MDKRIYPAINTLELNTKLLLNCFEDIDDSKAKVRIDGNTNSMIFIALHLVDARYYLAKLIGLDIDSPFYEQTKDANSIDDLREYPSLDKIKYAWEESHLLLAKKLEEMKENELDKKSSPKFPIKDKSLLGAITFLCQHESFHIGQLSLLRKYVGLPSMKYS